MKEAGLFFARLSNSVIFSLMTSSRRDLPKSEKSPQHNFHDCKAIEEKWRVFVAHFVDLFFTSYKTGSVPVARSIATGKYLLFRIFMAARHFEYST